MRGFKRGLKQGVVSESEAPETLLRIGSKLRLREVFTWR